MSSSLLGPTAEIVGYALDGLSLRHAAIASNIANANSIGFRPIKVSFEEQLSQWTDSVRGRSDASINPAAPQVTLDQTLPMGTGSDLLEKEAVALNRNVLQYEALIRGLNKQTSILTLAISEGKR
jgi:flagellar basal-body rod protein FlgB